MKKSLLSVAVAAAVAAPMSAQAIEGKDGHNVELYGRMQVEMTNVDSDFNGSTDDRYLNDNAMGRWGIFATEKLGNGMTVFGRFEWIEDTSDNTTGNTDRDQYVGVKGNWGTFLAGRAQGPYKITGGVKADPFVATQLEARSGGGMSNGAFGHNAFLSHVLVYATPEFGGFSGLAAWQADNSDANEDNPAGAYDSSAHGAWQVGAQYKNGPMWFWGAYSNANDSQDGVIVSGKELDDPTRWKLGGSFSFGNHTIRAQYEHENDRASSLGWGANRALGRGAGVTVSRSRPASDDVDYYWLAYELKLGNNSFFASFGREEYDAVAADSDLCIDSYTLGVRHKFSKTASVFGGFKMYDVDDDRNPDDGDVSVITVGLRKDFKI